MSTSHGLWNVSKDDSRGSTSIPTVMLLPVLIPSLAPKLLTGGTSQGINHTEHLLLERLEPLAKKPVSMSHTIKSASLVYSHTS